MVRSRPSIIYFSTDSRPIPPFVASWVAGRGIPATVVTDPAQIVAMTLRSLPALVLIDSECVVPGRELCRILKADSYSAIVPVVFLENGHADADVQAAFAAGADEVLTPVFGPGEQRARLDVLLLRTERDVSVHPSTRLPGTNEIERAIKVQMERGRSSPSATRTSTTSRSTTTATPTTTATASSSCCRGSCTTS